MRKTDYTPRKVRSELKHRTQVAKMVIKQHYAKAGRKNVPIIPLVMPHKKRNWPKDWEKRFRLTWDLKAFDECYVVAAEAVAEGFKAK